MTEQLLFLPEPVWNLQHFFMDRFIWLCEMMNVGPDDRVLEIGCGSGLAVKQMLPLLKKGKVTAIDRSATAIQNAVKRNAEAVALKQAIFVHSSLLDFPETGNRFTKIFSFNVNLFWTQKSITQETAKLQRLLQPDGQLYIFYGPLLPNAFDKISTNIARHAENGELMIKKISREDALNCCCFAMSFR